LYAFGCSIGPCHGMALQYDQMKNVGARHGVPLQFILT
jgi:hypothetical protein